MDAVIKYTLRLPGNEKVRSVNAVVGETNDAFLNDVRGQHVKVDHVISAISGAKTGDVEEGNVGAGTGTVLLVLKEALELHQGNFRKALEDILWEYWYRQILGECCK